jgi:hypothetical protein
METTIHSNHKVAEALLETGSDPNRTDIRGLNTYAWANWSNWRRIKQILTKYTKKDTKMNLINK